MFQRWFSASVLCTGLFSGLAFAAPPLVTSSEETAVSLCLKFDNQWERLLDICQQALDEVRDKRQRSRILHNIGYVQDELDQFDAAEKSFKAAIAIDDSISGIHSDLGWLYWRQDRLDDAKAAFQRSVDILPSSSSLSGLSNIERRVGEGPEAALLLIDGALAISPDDSWALRERGWCLFDLGRYTDAQQSFQASVDLTPDNGFAHLGLARSLQRRGKLDEALKSINAAIASIRDPSYTMLARRSNILREFDKAGAAIKDAKQAISLDPERAWAYVELARAQDALGRREAALETYENAVKKEIQSGYLLYWYADLLSEAARNRDALKVIDTALAMDDTDAADHELHAYIALELEDYSLVVTAAKNAIERDARSEYGHYYAALAYVSLNKLELASEHFDWAIKLDLPRELIGNFASYLISEGYMLKALQLRLRYK